MSTQFLHTPYTAFEKRKEKIKLAENLRLKDRYPDAQIVYGDTDSAMVKLPSLGSDIAALKKAFTLGPEIADMVTAHFPPPILLEFENVYWPFVQKAKKRYATCAYETEDLSKGKRSAKGLEVVRRDNATHLRDLYRDVLCELTPLVSEMPGEGDDRGFDLAEIAQRVQALIAEHMMHILEGTMPIEKFVVTKQLRSEYKGFMFSQQSCQFEQLDSVPNPPPPQGHVLLANRINQRISQGRFTSERPMPGDRIQFVVVLGRPGDQLRDRMESPEWLATLPDHLRPPIDKAYYIEKCMDAITGLCEQIFPVRYVFEASLTRLPRSFDPRQRTLTFSEGKCTAASLLATGSKARKKKKEYRQATLAFARK